MSLRGTLPVAVKFFFLAVFCFISAISVYFVRVRMRVAIVMANEPIDTQKEGV